MAGWGMRVALAALAAWILAMPAVARAADGRTDGVTVAHGLAQFGAPALGPDTTHPPYVNPDAPKGGTVRLSGYWPSFDSVNDLVVRGIPPLSLALIHDPLTMIAGDELGVVYGLLARTIEVPDDRSWVVFNLDPRAHFHDGHPVTAEDVVFMWRAVKDHGRPLLRSFLAPIETLEILGPHRLKAHLNTRDDMRPVVEIAKTLRPEPAHWWSAEGRDISRTTVEPPLSSGPYRMAAVESGRSIRYERIRDYWGGDLLMRRGQYNFDTVTVDFYRDLDVRFEAFKANAYDLRLEIRSQWWVTGYDFPAMRDGRVTQLTIPAADPLGPQAFRLNTRRDKLADPRVREALGYLFDFEWTQRNILYGQYTRVASNFPNSDFAAVGPPTPEERAILDSYRDRIADPRVFTEAFVPPGTDGSGAIRDNLRRALRLFRAAGWVLRDGRLVNADSGEAMTLEFLDRSTGLERIIQPYIRNLERAGIAATFRLVDSAQYQSRLDEYDFDIVTVNLIFYAPPGPGLRTYYSSAAADDSGSGNYSGVRDPVVDELLERVLAAKSLDEVMLLTRVLDRVLLWGFYMVPQWYLNEVWVAHWDTIARPERFSRLQFQMRSTGLPVAWWATSP